MFEIPVWDLLTSYSWDSKTLEFSWDIYEWFYDDLKFLKPLEMRIKLISVDNWITIILESLETQVKYHDAQRFVKLENIERSFHENKKDDDPDDIKYVKWWNIDLKEVIYEEILINIIE